jgi:spore coat protein SA
MSAFAYHLLTEAEPFSEFRGGAISRWAANVLRDSRNATIVCPSADSTWQFPARSLVVLSRLNRYRTVRRYLHRLPWNVHRRVIQSLFQPVLRRLRDGDIVWIHNRPDFAIALTPQIHRSGGKVVLHLHNSHLVGWPETLMRQVSVDRIVFVSDFLLKEAQRKFPSLGVSSVVSNGADDRVFYPTHKLGRSPEVPVVIFAGRLVKEKGAHILIQAMRLLESRGVSLRAQIVGSSAFGGGLETDYSKSLKVNAPQNVTFIPYCTGAALGQLFREADIFCSPSIWDEPFGLVNVEAFASGLPVVTTRGGGASEIFIEGGGILVGRGSVEQLACALQQLAEDQELRWTLGKQGYSAFRNRFTWSITRDHVQSICQALSA